MGRSLPLPTMRALACLAIFAAALLSLQRPPPLELAIQYRAHTEDDASNSGSVSVPLDAGSPARAVVWERECVIGGAANSAEPSSPSDQYWTFAASEETGQRGRQIRIRYRVVVNGATKPSPEQVYTMPAEATPLVLHELSARRDCRYDRLTITIAARTR